MSLITVQGLHALKGEIKIQGSKNAVLPMMAASILHSGTTVLENVPRIQDVFCMLGILKTLGCVCSLEGHRLVIQAAGVDQATIPECFVKLMRSSIIVMGALLGRLQKARTSYPGGCSIGERPIDLHLKALRNLGADITENETGELTAVALKLIGTDVFFSFPSVGATENALLAAVLAEGVTVIHGAAREPEIEELCAFLNGMGARIYGSGTSILSICGVKELHDSSYEVKGDRIVAGTYLSAVLAAGGEAVLTGVPCDHMLSVIAQAEHMGACVVRMADVLKVAMWGRPEPYLVVTGPYPEFPTDMQSLMMAVMAMGAGTGRIEENVFEGRFETAKELQKMGADIRIEQNRAVIHGTYPLTGTSVTAQDLRGGAALVVAGLAADGVTVIDGCRHIMRGYENICRDLQTLGACIKGVE